MLRIDDDEHFSEAVHDGGDFLAYPAVCVGVDGRLDEFFCKVDAVLGRNCAEEERVEAVRPEARAVEGVGVFEYFV